MNSRSSTRVRARDANEESKDAGAAPAERVTKRARAGATVAVAVSAVEEDVKSTPWVHQSLPPAKRAAWDAIIKTHFFVSQPHDLYDLFELAVHVAPDKPQDAFVSTAGIRLMGPFDLLARSGCAVRSVKPLHLHGRYFLDPPEVVTVLDDVESSTGAHWGLYRDKPSDVPTYVVHTENTGACSFKPVATSLFTVLRDRLLKRGAARSQLDLVEDYIKRHRATCYKTPAELQKRRSSESLAKSLHGMGIVAPFDAKKRSGFRELPIVNEQLRDLLTNVQAGDATAKTKITNLITRATIANDECDFGTSLLLGLDLFTANTALQKEAVQLLRVAYMLLGRKEFAKVVSDHVKHRAQGHAALNCLTEASTDATASTVDLP